MMNLRTEDVNSILIVSVPTMDLDASKADEFKKSAGPLVQGHSRVIMDLSGIGFMDSAGLGAILSVFKKVRADGGQFRVFGLSEEVKALFELVRMQRLLEVYSDRETAISDFQAT
jgi:anti-sigma B factor antagonist